MRNKMLNWIEISSSNLENNINQIKSIIPDDTKIMAVVKGNAYGHGSVLVARKLKELGINAIELMPCYEFNEINDCTFSKKYPISSSITRPYYNDDIEWKLNYWGYSEEHYYFAPKASYAKEPENCCLEFKEMINALHENGIEVYMEFYFGFNTNQSLIADRACA